MRSFLAALSRTLYASRVRKEPISETSAVLLPPRYVGVFLTTSQFLFVLSYSHTIFTAYKLSPAPDDIKIIPQSVARVMGSSGEQRRKRGMGEDLPLSSARILRISPRESLQK